MTIAAAIVLSGLFGTVVAKADELEGTAAELTSGQGGILSEQEPLLRAAATLDSGTWGTCPWELTADGTLVIHPGTGVAQDASSWSPSYPWYIWAKQIKTIRATEENGCKVVVPKGCYWLFMGLESLVTADLSGLDTSHTDQMWSWFNGCTALVTINATGWDTSQVTQMGMMFQDCSSLAKIDVSGWNTSSVTNMYDMFSGCTSLKSLDVSGWDTSHVRSMREMFNGCYRLESVDVSGWDTSSCEDTSSMFEGCSMLDTLDVSGWKISHVNSAERMFSGCEMLGDLDVSSWDTSSIQRMDYMFQGCWLGLRKLDVSGWNTSQVWYMDHMFDGCSVLSKLDVSNWNTSQVECMDYMFCNCFNLTALDVSSWDTSAVRTMYGMFDGCYLDEFKKGSGYVPCDGDGVPASTADDERWWSIKDERWFTKDQIAYSRATLADSYAAFEVRKNDISKAKATIADQTYTGKALTPKPKVTFSGMQLSEGSDYTLSYKNNIKPGTATVTIAGKGMYFGTKTVTFKIIGPAAFFLDADPTDDNNHGAEVDWMGTSGISTGWEVAGGREFRGMQNVKRCDFAAFLYRLGDVIDDGARNDSIALSDEQVTATLATVSDCDADTPHAAEVAWMVDSGISKGWQDKGRATVSFRPMANVARQDMAAFLYRFADLVDDNQHNKSPKKGAEQVTFSDVKSGDEANHASEVEWLASVGVTKGWSVSGGRFEFRGKKTVARQDMAAFMYRLNGRLRG